MGCPRWLSGNVTKIFSLYSFLAVALSFAVGLAGLFDYMNVYTVRMDQWKGIGILLFSAMALGLFIGTAVLGLTPGQEAYATEQAGKKGLLKSMLADERLDCISRTCAQVKYFVLMSLVSVWALGQILFLYNYTTTETGVQANMDGGFPHDDGTWTFTVQRKNDFLWLLQLQGVVSLVCFVDYVVRCIAQSRSRGK